MNHTILTGEQAAYICQHTAKQATKAGDRYGSRALSSATMMCVRWGANLHVTGTAENPETLLVAYPQKLVKGDWGRYVNRILVYTPPHLRRIGSARALDREVAEYYIDQGLSRVKTLSGSVEGYALHHAYGWTAWAVNKNGEIFHDAPLAPRFNRPGVPPMAAKFGVTRPLNAHEIQAALTDPNGPYVKR